jgi:hypothetical protein
VVLELGDRAWDLGRFFGTSYVRWARYVACVGTLRNAYKMSVEKPTGKRPLGRTRRRCEDNNIKDLNRNNV